MEKKFLLGVFFILILAVISAIAIFNYNLRQPDRACFKNNCFLVEVAKTSEERSRGLMFREGLDSNKGMLFVFEEEGRYSFWMKNTLIPLDIIWINQNKEVVFISENSQPCKEEPCSSIGFDGVAKYVLEINGGMAGKIGLNVNDKITLKIK